MFSGFTNQMSSISSWIGAKKAPGGSQEGSPQNAEERPIEDSVASPGIYLMSKCIIKCD
jgi:hypothetical protein